MAEQFFKHFPTIDYDPTGNKQTKSIKDILIRIKIKDKVRNQNVVFSKYDVKEGQRPEDVAFEQYGDSEFHWIILMMKMIQKYSLNRLKLKYLATDGLYFHFIQNKKNRQNMYGGTMLAKPRQFSSHLKSYVNPYCF